ncbi:hypothetical protein J6590_052471 [Homalodisca vitripennis]|nr:hypothetical protein J6590_052471 [Homalodisca vitripennis]
MTVHGRTYHFIVSINDSMTKVSGAALHWLLICPKFTSKIHRDTKLMQTFHLSF